MELFGDVGWEYATLVIHLRDDVPDFVLPVLNKKTIGETV